MIKTDRYVVEFHSGASASFVAQGYEIKIDSAVFHINGVTQRDYKLNRIRSIKRWQEEKELST